MTELDHLDNVCASLNRYHSPRLVSLEVSQKQYDDLKSELLNLWPKMEFKKCHVEFFYKGITFSIYNKDCLIE